MCWTWPLQRSLYPYSDRSAVPTQLSYCSTDQDDCSKTTIGYSVGQIVSATTGVNYSTSARDSATKGLVLIPVAAGVSFLAFLVAAVSHKLGFFVAAFVAALGKSQPRTSRVMGANERDRGASAQAPIVASTSETNVGMQLTHRSSLSLYHHPCGSCRRVLCLCIGQIPHRERRQRRDRRLWSRVLDDHRCGCHSFLGLLCHASLVCDGPEKVEGVLAGAMV